MALTRLPWRLHKMHMAPSSALSSAQHLYFFRFMLLPEWDQCIERFSTGQWVVLCMC